MVAIFAVVASFALIAPAVLAEPLTPATLIGRQIGPLVDPSMLPAACVDSCQAFSQSVVDGKCAALDCLCTQKVATGLADCLTCAAKIAGGTDFTADDVKQTLDGYITSCQAGGFKVTADGFAAATTDSATATGTNAGTTKAATGSTSATGTATGTATGKATGSSTQTTATAPAETTTPAKSAGSVASFSVAGSVVAAAMAGLALL